MVQIDTNLPPAKGKITSFYMKRKSDGTSIASPTGETKSPEKQKQKATTETNEVSNAPTPKEEAPQRDKTTVPPPDTPSAMQYHPTTEGNKVTPEPHHVEKKWH